MVMLVFVFGKNLARFDASGRGGVEICRYPVIRYTGMWAASAACQVAEIIVSKGTSHVVQSCAMTACFRLRSPAAIPRHTGDNRQGCLAPHSWSLTESLIKCASTGLQQGVARVADGR